MPLSRTQLSIIVMNEPYKSSLLVDVEGSGSLSSADGSGLAADPASSSSSSSSRKSSPKPISSKILAYVASRSSSSSSTTSSSGSAAAVSFAAEDEEILRVLVLHSMNSSKAPLAVCRRAARWSSSGACVNDKYKIAPRHKSTTSRDLRSGVGSDVLNSHRGVNAFWIGTSSAKALGTSQKRLPSSVYTSTYTTDLTRASSKMPQRMTMIV
mmetsp:Transcript_6966/g.25651  ORF Transcript_6966/g.25651 Transcript_6966/m.25651 type:complete len:211 (-) Transcript_6966:740-1372(-)